MAGSGYDKNNKGSISKNKDKTEPNHKDYNGKALIDGKEYWVAGWVKDGQYGKFLSLAFEPKNKTQNSSSSSKRSNQQEEESSEDMPF